MIQIQNPKDFPENSLLGFFSGKNYEEAMKEAVEWAERLKVTLTHFYQQRAFGKSIIVGWRRPHEETTDLA